MYTGIYESEIFFTSVPLNGADADQTSSDNKAEDASDTSAACTSEPADPTPTEEQRELQEADNSAMQRSMMFNRLSVNLIVSITDIRDEMNLFEGELKILTSGEYPSITLSN